MQEGEWVLRRQEIHWKNFLIVRPTSLRYWYL